MSHDPWDLSGCIARLMAFRRARDWEQFHRPKELAAALAIEAAELQELFLWKPEESAAQVRADRDRFGRVEEELADVAIFAVMLAHDLGIDLSGAIERKIERNERRYPVDEHRGIARKAVDK